MACMGGTMAGLAWIFSPSAWKITNPEQVQIVGSRYLSEATIRSSLSLQYPQWLVQLEPAKIKQKLLQQGGIVDVDVERSLFPPRVTIRIDDRPPVAAIVTPNNPNSPRSLIDFRGVITPIDRYRTDNRPTPSLRVMLPEAEICPHWPKIYQAIQTSPVAIRIVDCRQARSMRLQTELGQVRLGSYQHEQRLAGQIQQLDRLRNLSQQVKIQSIDHIDLENPDRPKVQLKPVETNHPQ